MESGFLRYPGARLGQGPRASGIETFPRGFPREMGRACARPPPSCDASVKALVPQRDMHVSWARLARLSIRRGCPPLGQSQGVLKQGSFEPRDQQKEGARVRGIHADSEKSPPSIPWRELGDGQIGRADGPHTSPSLERLLIAALLKPPKAFFVQRLPLRTAALRKRPPKRVPVTSSSFFFPRTWQGRSQRRG